MNKTLGLDIGTNSIGSAVIELENSHEKILHLGTRFIPAGGDQYNYFIQGKPLTNSKGQTVSSCAERRNFRSQRRNLDRYKQRRDNLILIFDILGIKPDGMNCHIDYSGKYPKVSILPFKRKRKTNIDKNNYDIENTELFKIYKLRYDAVNEQINLNKLGRILYTLNIRRGYQDIGLLNNEDDDELTIRRLKSNQKIIKLNIIDVVFTNNFRKKKPEFDFIGIENELDQISGKAYIPYFEKYIGKNIEFILEEDKEGNIELKLYKKTEWSKSREENNASLGAKTIGEKLFEDILEVKNNPRKKHWHLKLRNRVYDRKYYEKEFERIWNKQSEFHDVLNNSSKEILEKIAEILVPKNIDKQKLLTEKGLKYIFKEYIIFYQRPLKKGQKELISKCAFEKDEKKLTTQGKTYTIIHRGIPKSHPLYQEFRVWQTINNIIIKNNIGDNVYLVDAQYKLIFELLNKSESVYPLDILKELNLSKEEYFVNYRNEVRITGNKTFAAIKKCFAKQDKIKLESIFNNGEQYNKLWHIIYSIPPVNKDGKFKALTDGIFSYKTVNEFNESQTFCLNLSVETAKKLAELRLEDKYGSLSHKAILKLLPLMKRGLYFSTKNLPCDVKEKIYSIINDGVVDTINPKFLEKIGEFETIEDFQGLRYDEAAELVYGKHTKEIISASYHNPEEIQLIKQHSLRHPIVEKIINETLQTVKEIWTDPKIGKPYKIAIELARELQNSQKQREKIYKSQLSNKAINDDVQVRLQSDQFNISNPTKRQIEKYKLWKEQKYRCPYTNCYIAPQDLFAIRSNGEYKYDIDHIVPRTRLKDDSLSNKVLCLRDANLAKRSQLARAFMEKVRNYKDLRSFDDYIKFAKGFSLSKRNKLLMKDENIPDDFIERQLKETQYITKRVVEELSKIVGSENIILTSGGITALLRHEWGIDDIFKLELKERYQNWENKLKASGINREIIKVEGHSLTINEFNKRVDLRNHALDALVVACTNVKHIKYYNDLNKIHQNSNDPEYKGLKEFVTEIINDNGKAKLRLKKPWKDFCKDTADITKQIIISIKNNRIYTNNDGAVKGLLHDQNPIGWRLITGTPIPLKQFIEILKNQRSSNEIISYIENNLPNALRIKILEKLTDYNFDILRFEKEINTNPLLDRNNNPIETVTTVSKKLVSRIDLLSVSEKTIKEGLIVDKTILEDLKTHINNYKTHNEAFLPESIELFNTEREEQNKFPIRKLLTRGREDFNPNDYTSNNRIIQRKNSFSVKSVFSLKDKAYSIIYEGIDHNGSKKRLHKPIPLFDYIQATKLAETFVEKVPGYDKYLLFDSYNFMYVPEPDEFITNQTFENKKDVFKKLYYLKRISGSQWYFLPHYVGKPMSEKINNGEKEVIINEFGVSTEDFEKDLTFNLNIKDCGIPVTVDRIGKLKPIEWISF
jgi:CRISPR-associated endonuclease Csn1